MNQIKLNKTVKSILFAVGSLLVALNILSPELADQIPILGETIVGAVLAVVAFIGAIRAENKNVVAAQSEPTITKALVAYVQMK